MGRADELFVVAIVVVERAAEVSGVGAAAVLLRSSTVAVGKVTGRREAGALPFCVVASAQVGRRVAARWPCGYGRYLHRRRRHYALGAR